MTVDPRLESLYGQVQLVRGAGNRKRGRLCIMSFVAFLAEEPHSDAPITASPLIRRYAMTINDEMPDYLRQRLKTFAPRILGTRDGRERARARLLIEAVRFELIPRVVADFGFTIEHMLRPSRSAPSRVEIWEDLTRVAAYECDGANALSHEEIAAVAARLIARCGQAAVNAADREWYWAKAIELLDRLCDVGADCRQSPVSMVHVAAMNSYLSERNEIHQRRARAVATLTRVCNLVPALLR